MTGAAGTLGTALVPRLLGRGLDLRLSDVRATTAFPQSVDCRAVDLIDENAVRHLCHGATSIIHFGGISFEQPLDALLGSNVIGTENVFKAAKEAGARVIYASSNHVAGYYPRDEKLTPDLHSGPTVCTRFRRPSENL